MRLATTEVQTHAKRLSEGLLEYDAQAKNMIDLFSDCGFEEFNDLFQSISSLMTSYSSSIAE